MITTEEKNILVALTAEIVSAHVTHNTVAVSDLSMLIAKVHAALAELGTRAEQPTIEQQPAVSIRASVKPDYIVCLEDGKRMKMLKRHLMTDHQMTPADYRAKWKLPDDYPMVASAYASKRRTMALSYGLGKRRKIETDPAVEPTVEADPAAPPAAPELPAAPTPKARKPRLKALVDRG